MPKRCVFGCAPINGSFHSFPNPKKFRQQLNAWVDVTGDFGMTCEEIFKRKKVCDAHFTTKDRNRNNRLNALAIPSLHLNGFHGKLPIPDPSEVELTTKSDAGCLEHITPSNIYQDKATPSCTIEDINKQSFKSETNSGSEDEESIVLDPDSELWGFFDKQPHNKAKCSMCDERLRRDADTLYKHLKEKHSNISEILEYKDNEENFTEVIYLEEPIESIKEDQDKLLFEVQPKAKKTFKRRYSTRDDVKYIEPNKSQSKEDVEIENFGKYITGLLKGVPRAASSKLQMEIVTLIMNTKIKLQTTPDIDSEVVERSKESDPPDIGQENQENQDNLDTTTSSEFGTNQDTRTPKRPKRRISYREEYSYKINLTENEEREIENFGTYVTCLLKTVPENKISAKLQMNIVNLIMTARLQALQKNVPVLTINGTIELDNTNVDDNQVMLTDSNV